MTDSNRRPSACKADALNQLSYAPEQELVPFLSIGIAKVQQIFKRANFFKRNLVYFHFLKEFEYCLKQFLQAGV